MIWEIVGVAPVGVPRCEQHLGIAGYGGVFVLGCGGFRLQVRATRRDWLPAVPRQAMP